MQFNLAEMSHYYIFIMFLLYFYYSFFLKYYFLKYNSLCDENHETSFTISYVLFHHFLLFSKVKIVYFRFSKLKHLQRASCFCCACNSTNLLTE